MQHRLFWDLETGPQPPEQLLKLMPEFTAAANLRDPEKIEASITAKRQAWLDDAALRGTTGQVLAFGMAQDDDPVMVNTIEGSNEKALISALFQHLYDAIMNDWFIYTWNGAGFDLPFLCQRLASHGKPGFWYLTKGKGRRYWDDHFIDAMQVWNMQSGHVSGSGLDAVAKALGVGEKNGDGAMFYELFKADPDKAKAYCANDVELLRKVVLRMGI